MAVSTQNFDVVSIGLPVLESFAPGVSAILGRKFLPTFNVVNIQHSYVIVAATNALATKRLYQFNLSLPYAALVREPTVLVPEVPLAIGRAEPTLTGATTVEARSGDLPAGFVVAGHGTELSIRSILGGIKRATAVLANLFRAILWPVGGDANLTLVPGIDRGFSSASHRAVYFGTLAMKLVSTLRAGVNDLVHTNSIAQFIGTCKSGYFEIARKRIAAAQEQMPLLAVGS